MNWKHYFTFLKTLKVWEHHFQLPRFFALLRTSLPTTKKEPSFGAFIGIAWNRKKRYLYCALKHRLVKWEIDEERTIDVKISFTRKLKTHDFFFNKTYLFLTFILNDRHSQKRTILHFVLRCCGSLQVW